MPALLLIYGALLVAGVGYAEPYKGPVKAVLRPDFISVPKPSWMARGNRKARRAG